MMWLALTVIALIGFLSLLSWLAFRLTQVRR